MALPPLEPVSPAESALVTDLRVIDGRLPQADMLHAMPAEVKQEVERIAQRKVRCLLAPLVLLWRACRRRRKEIAAAGPLSEPALVAALRQSQLIERWPLERVQSMARQGLRHTARPGEVVIHEGETAVSGMWVLMRGRVKVVKSGADTKSVDPLHPGNTVLAELFAPEVLGDFTQLTEQPRTASIIATESCEWVSIPKVVFTKELEQLPEQVQQHVYSMAFAKRRAIMWAMFPMRPDDFRQSFLFREIADEQLLALQNYLKPRCFRRGELLCSFGESGHEMYFIRRGEVEVLVPAQAMHPEGEEDDGGDPTACSRRVSDSSARRGQPRHRGSIARNFSTSSAAGPTSPQGEPCSPAQEATPLWWTGGKGGPLQAVARLGAGATVGEMSLVFGERRSASIRALTHCDVWSLLFSDLEMCLGDGVVRMQVRDAANGQRLLWLAEGQSTYTKVLEGLMEPARWSGEEVPDNVLRERMAAQQGDLLLQSVLRCPLLRDACTAACLADIRLSLEPHVYSPRDAITSKSDICDRLLVMSRGKACIQDPQVTAGRGRLHPGDMVGFTCLAEHRWLHAVTASVTCDCWELPRVRLQAILTKHDCLGKAQALVRRLLSGQQPVPDFAQATPVLFPRPGEAKGDGHARLLSYTAVSTPQGRRRSVAEQPRSDSPRAAKAQGSFQDSPANSPRNQGFAVGDLLPESRDLNPGQRERRALLRQSLSSPSRGSMTETAALEARVDAATRRLSQQGSPPRSPPRDNIASPLPVQKVDSVGSGTVSGTEASRRPSASKPPPSLTLAGGGAGGGGGGGAPPASSAPPLPPPAAPKGPPAAAPAPAKPPDPSPRPAASPAGAQLGAGAEPQKQRPSPRPLTDVVTPRGLNGWGGGTAEYGLAVTGPRATPDRENLHEGSSKGTTRERGDSGSCEIFIQGGACDPAEVRRQAAGVALAQLFRRGVGAAFAPRSPEPVVASPRSGPWAASCGQRRRRREVSPWRRLRTT